MLERTIAHFIDHAVPSAHDYWEAEAELSAAYESNEQDKISSAELRAIRMAANASIAIDGLSDRIMEEQGVSKRDLRKILEPLCQYPSGEVRDGALERVRAVANAYKHAELDDPTLPITSDADIITVGLGWGLDAYGIGKMGGVEVIVCQTDGVKFKFLGDIPCVLRGWATYLRTHGTTLPTDPILFGPWEIHP